LTILNEPDAAALFRRLLEEADLAGQLYALCGLFLVDYDTFRAAIEPYRELDETVNTHFGCLLAQEFVSSIVESPAGLRLSSPDETLEELIERNGWPEGTTFDILGGSYSASFVNTPSCLTE
jgi:hypothetical protein